MFEERPLSRRTSHRGAGLQPFCSACFIVHLFHRGVRLSPFLLGLYRHLTVFRLSSVRLESFLLIFSPTCAVLLSLCVSFSYTRLRLFLHVSPTILTYALVFLRRIPCAASGSRNLTTAFFPGWGSTPVVATGLCSWDYSANHLVERISCAMSRYTL